MASRVDEAYGVLMRSGLLLIKGTRESEKRRSSGKLLGGWPVRTDTRGLETLTSASVTHLLPGTVYAGWWQTKVSAIASEIHSAPSVTNV